MWFLCFVPEYGCLFYKQKTACEWRMSYWSSDVCSSDLERQRGALGQRVEIGGTVVEVLEVSVELGNRTLGGRAHVDHRDRTGGAFRSSVEIGRASRRERVG